MRHDILGPKVNHGDLAPDDPTVTYRLVEATGKALYEITLKRRQLTPA